MSAFEDLVPAAMTAPADRQKEALRLLRGQPGALGEKPTPVPPGPEPYLTLRETAKRLGMSTATLWRWKIPSHELGGRPRFRISEVEAYLQSEEFKRRVAALRAIRRERCNRETQPRRAPTTRSPKT
jgi:predicted DNA-binding transcriptional regulator AlpA